MYDFIKNQWVMHKFTQSQVEACVTKGYITSEQAAEILNTKQV